MRNIGLDCVAAAGRLLRASRYLEHWDGYAVARESYFKEAAEAIVAADGAVDGCCAECTNHLRAKVAGVKKDGS